MCIQHNKMATLLKSRVYSRYPEGNQHTQDLVA